MKKKKKVVRFTKQINAFFALPDNHARYFEMKQIVNSGNKALAGAIAREMKKRRTVGRMDWDEAVVRFQNEVSFPNSESFDFHGWRGETIITTKSMKRVLFNPEKNCVSIREVVLAGKQASPEEVSTLLG